MPSFLFAIDGARPEMIAEILSLFGYEKKSAPRIDQLTSGVYGGSTASGVSVTPSTAMKSAIVYACVRVLSESVAQLPLILYRRNGKARERATDHPLYWLLHDAPNQNQTSFEYREMKTAHLCLRGNACSFINRVNRGREIKELNPFHPDKVNIKVEPDGEMKYEVTHDDGTRETYPREKIFHLRGLSLDGYVGVSPITYARETIGFNLAAERHGAQIFSNAARPGGVLLYKDGALDDDAKKSLVDGWQNAYSGENAGKTALLEYGIEWKPMSMTSVDAQWLESRRFALQDVARFYRMQLHKVQEMSQATYSNIEQQNIEFVVDTLLPWLRRWEQAISRDLLTPEERKVYFVEFLVDGLLRGDAKSRNEALSIMRNAGALNANEWREMVNMNPRTDPGGDSFWMPANMLESGAAEGKAPAKELRLTIGLED